VSLHAREATGFNHMESIRLIRNTCREGFSQYNEPISGADQVRWWAATEGKRLAWLYTDDERLIVGFGVLLLQDDGFWTTTVAVLPEHAGKGYGKVITHDIVTRCPGPCKATARKDNPAAVKLHVAEDWDVVDGPDERLVYFRTKAGVTA
jgi:GNAT superfamily N-acetyltransferase